MSKALCIPGKGHSRRPLTGLGVLAALCLVFWLAVSVFLHIGGRTIAPTLADESGDDARLEGFTLSGQIGWNRIYDRMHFTLEDGILRSQLTLDDPDAAAMEGTYLRFYTNRSYVVPAEQRAAANEKATISGSDSDGDLYINVPVDTVCGMYTISLPDGTALRLRAGNMTLPEPDNAWAALEKTPQRELDYAYDYTWNSGIPEMEASWPGTPLSGDGFALGAGYGLCWAQDYLGRAPGLYRARGLTAQEIAALPRDGQVYGKEVLCGSTEFGSLEPFYCPEDAAEALAGVSMADGSTLLLYRSDQDLLCADLVNAAGIATDHRELGPLDGQESPDTVLMPRTDDRDAVLRVVPGAGTQDDTGTAGHGGTGLLVAFRIENGRFALAGELPLQETDVAAAVLNTQGDALLLVREDLAYDGQTPTLPGPGYGTLELQVCTLADGRCLYRGRLDVGGGRDWSGLPNTRSTGQRRQITYDKLQKDGGLLS